MRHVSPYSQSLLLAGVLLVSAGCSGGSIEREESKDAPPNHAEPAEFSIAWTNLRAFLVPTDQDAAGKTAEQALAELHKGMVEDPQTLALLRRLNADLPVEVEVIPGPNGLAANDETQRNVASEELMGELQVKPREKKQVALRVCAYHPEKVKDAKVTALQFLCAYGYSFRVPDRRSPTPDDTTSGPQGGWGGLRLAEQDYMLRKVPGWYSYTFDQPWWDANFTTPLDAAAERKKLDSLIDQEERRARKSLDDLRNPLAPK